MNEYQTLSDLIEQCGVVYRSTADDFTKLHLVLAKTHAISQVLSKLGIPPIDFRDWPEPGTDAEALDHVMEHIEVLDTSFGNLLP